MKRQQAVILFVGLLAFMSLACNAFAGQTPEPALTLPAPVVGEVTNTPTLPGIGTFAPTATLPGTGQPPTDDGSPLATVLVDLNIRSGPSIQYPRVGFLLKGSSVPIIGRNPETGWWKVTCPVRAEGDACWISGGSQYTRAQNATAVASLPAPPIPTPTRPANGGFVAYADGRGLWMLTLDGADPPQPVETPKQLATAVIDRLAISPDGRHIAFIVDTYPTNEMYVVNVEDGNGRLLVDATKLPPPPAGTAVAIGQIEWLSDSQQIAFNTIISSLEGPGIGSQEDLWTVGLDGTLSERFAEGTGGGAFAISPNNQVLMSQNDTVILASLDGSKQTAVINFDMINTASEYIYYPQPQWLNDGSNARIIIPSAEPFSDNPTATLWHVANDGSATAVGDVSGNILFNQPQWSPDGSHLAYIKMNLDDTPQLTITDGSGNNPTNYDSGQPIQFYSWNGNGRHFLYNRQNFLGVGQIDGVAQQLAQQTVDGRWLTTTTYIIQVGSNSNDWMLRSGNLTGTTADLVTSQRSGAMPFAIWP